MLEDAARYADEFSLSHKEAFVEMPRRPYVPPGEVPTSAFYPTRDKVVVNAIVTEKPSVEQSPDLAEKIIPGLYPAFTVTRAMSKTRETDVYKVTLKDTVINQVLEGKHQNQNQWKSFLTTVCRNRLKRCQRLSLLQSSAKTQKS